MTPQSILPTELNGALMRFIGFPGIGKSYLGASLEVPGLSDYVDFESKARAIAEQLSQRGTPFGAYNAINEQVAGKGALAMFDLFRQHIDDIVQDQFTTMVLDNVAELQKAAVAHVEANAKEYAANSSLKEKFIKSGNAGQQFSGAGIAFANLFSSIRDKGVQLIICVSHIGPQWAKNTQVPGKWHVGGVKVLDTLSSLSLILMPPRPDTEGWPPPAALVSKESLGTFSFQADLTPEQIEDIKRGEIPSHIMAPRFPRRIWPCTSQAIKRYLTHPADYENLNEHEIPTDDELFMFSEKLSKEQMSFVLNAQALERMEKAQAVPAKSVNPQSLIARAQAQQAQPESPQITQAKVAAGKLRDEGKDIDQIREELRETYPPPVVAAAVRNEAPF